ncbi:hypothetical protein [Armatimonas sp.]|uniref:hypothetical protein n=1 Tax=Armatimonas sp. TaxID=1872638 RepID=UPI003750E2E9
MSAPITFASVKPVGSVVVSESRACAMLSTAGQRAEILLEVGYRIQPVDPTNGLFFVWRPPTAKRKFDNDDNEILGYFVQLGTGRDPVRCDCECFRLAGNCKHHLRVRTEAKKFLRFFGLVPDPALDNWIIERCTALEGEGA